MENTEVKISKVFKQLGILPNILGYEYGKEAIDMVLKDNTVLHAGVTKIMYPAIAKKMNTTSSRVERAIRHAIEKAYIRGDLKLIEDIFGYGTSSNTGRVTNSEFIAGIAQYIKLEQENDA